MVEKMVASAILVTPTTSTTKAGFTIPTLFVAKDYLIRPTTITPNEARDTSEGRNRDKPRDTKTVAAKTPYLGGMTMRLSRIGIS